MTEQSTPAKKAKKPKTMADRQKRLKLKKDRAIDCLLKAISSRSDNDLIVAQKTLSGYVSLRSWIAKKVDPSGAIIPDVHPTEYLGDYYIRTRKDKETGLWSGQISYYFQDVLYVLYEVSGHEHGSQCYAACLNASVELGYRDRMARRFPIFYEGDLDFNVEKKRLDDSRIKAISEIVRLMALGASSKASETEVDLAFNECRLHLERFSTIRFQFYEHWNDKGEWVGRKRKPEKKLAD